jgi:hypothetical protein
MDLMPGNLCIIPGNLSSIICHRFDLSLPVFRGSKGPIQEKLSLQQLRRPLHIHTPLVSANAVIMLCMECIWTSYCMRLLDRAPVCMGGEVLFPFLVLFLFLSGILARLSGLQQVRAALYACTHRGPSGRCLVGIASMDS